jgi:hypothetical protein
MRVQFSMWILALTLVGSSLGEFAIIKSEIAKWGKVIRDARIGVD